MPDRPLLDHSVVNEWELGRPDRRDPPMVAPVHNRMPVILSLDLLNAWLDPAAELTELEPMLAPAPEETLRVWPVSTAVNRVATDGPELLRPVELPRTLGLV